jgi:glycosyltransferase involved in cell wall biosynthesis
MESTVKYFTKRNYNVFFLTTCEKGAIHNELEKDCVVCNQLIEGKQKLFFNLRAIFVLISFSRKNKIDVIYSHLQIPNLIASMAAFFTRSLVLTVRHNSDVTEIAGSLKEKIIERIINLLSPHIIAISDKVKIQLTEKERVSHKKIYRINNGYDFSCYESLTLGEEERINIRKKYNCDLLILSIGRLVKTKRHELTINGISKLNSKGLNVKLLILGEGPEQPHLIKKINSEGLSNSVYLLGYKENICDYIIASDVLALLSESEASNNSAKEAGYFERPVIVCQNVGDFSDYIINAETGFLISKTEPVDEFVKCCEILIKDSFRNTGKKLKATIIREFDIEQIGRQYEQLHKQLLEET